MKRKKSPVIDKIYIYQKDALDRLANFEQALRNQWIEYQQDASDEEGSFLYAYSLYVAEKNQGSLDDFVAEIKSLKGYRYLVKRTGEIVCKKA